MKQKELILKFKDPKTGRSILLKMKPPPPPVKWNPRQLAKKDEKKIAKILNRSFS